MEENFSCRFLLEYKNHMITLKKKSPSRYRLRISTSKIGEGVRKMADI